MQLSISETAFWLIKYYLNFSLLHRDTLIDEICDTHQNMLLVNGWFLTLKEILTGPMWSWHSWGKLQIFFDKTSKFSADTFTWSVQYDLFSSCFYHIKRIGQNKTFKWK